MLSWGGLSPSLFLMNQITIIVTKRLGESAKITLDSLANQTFKDFVIYEIEDTEYRGAPWARNEGFIRAPKNEFTLFSDNDIAWEPTALETLINALKDNPDAAYAYGSYEVEGVIGIGDSQDFDGAELVRRNYISTMSLIRTHLFNGFDETLGRLQDWDLWLSMLWDGYKGIYCGKKIFSTKVRDGISFGKNSQDLVCATQRVIDKYARMCA
jgi:glycosyltransferase involved in cell wall biosynthesis